MNYDSNAPPLLKYHLPLFIRKFKWGLSLKWRRYMILTRKIEDLSLFKKFIQESCVYVDTFTLRDGVRQHLAEIHHNHRLRRFSEGFFTMRNPRKAVLCCLDAKHQHHLTVSDAVRKSEYFQSLPNLQIHCKVRIRFTIIYTWQS